MEEDIVIATTADSALWKTMVRVWPNFAQYEYRSVGNGMITMAWNHSWIAVDYKIADIDIPPNLQQVS